MASCLGLYIEENLIKYAKVSKSNETMKVESFGIKFYDNLESTINQIIEETYSYKTPISINVSEEIYNEFEIFSLLSKKDMDNMVKTHFESVCYEKNENPDAYEQRYIPAGTNIQSEKVKMIHISTTKASISQRKNQFADHKISQALPIGITISNLLKREKKTTNLIVNIEKNTILTRTYDNLVSDVKVLSVGSKDILNSINRKENSYSKAYEICKNSTIYTDKDKDLQYEENEYLVDIMPTLYEIVSEVRNIIENSVERINKVYITGTASVINNIDIYFEEYLKDVQCEVLKPSFINNNMKLNMKDYIEVNSAISLALQGLDKNNNINFTKNTASNKGKSIFKKEITLDTFKSIDFSKYSRPYNITFFTFVLIIIFYLGGYFIINKQLDYKIGLAETAIKDTKEKISKVKSYEEIFNDQTAEYENLIEEINNKNDIDSENKRFKNAIPILLNSIKAIIPEKVYLVTIKNTSDDKIVITAQAEQYEQIAYFKTKLKVEEVLKNVVSDTGVMRSGKITVTIEGELP